jgi:16S rRNA processing protein RimM
LGPSPLLEVGRVVKAHGLHGEVVVELWTDQTQRLHPGSSLVSPRGALRVASSRLFGGPGGGTRDRYLVRFESMGDRTAAESLRGVELSAPPLDVPGTLWVHELVGSVVRDGTGSELGRVAAVESNPASDLMVLESGALIPVRFVTGHDPSGHTVDVDIPDGLLEV